MAQNTTSNRGYDDTVYIPRQQRLRPMILTRKVQQFYLVYLCFPDGSEMQIAAYMMPNDGNWRANDAFYEELIAFAKKYDIIVLHDNAYSDIIFDGAVGHSIFNIPGAETCAVEFFSLSKSFNVTGARISFLVGRRDVIAACKKLRTQIDFGKFIPEQKAAIAAMTGPLEPIKAQCAEYQRRRDALCGGFRSIGWDVPDSHGSMFVWAPVPQGHGTSMEFCMEMIEKAGVICTPGSSFGPSGEGYVRFALTLPVKKITEAVQAVKNSGLIG